MSKYCSVRLHLAIETVHNTNLFGLVIVLALALMSVCPVLAGPRLFGTTGSGGTISTLVELNSATGALLQTIGSVGYAVNGLTYDVATGKLWGATSLNDPNFMGLI